MTLLEIQKLLPHLRDVVIHDYLKPQMFWLDLAAIAKLYRVVLKNLNISTFQLLNLFRRPRPKAKNIHVVNYLVLTRF